MYITKEQQQQQLKWHKEQNLRPLNSSDDVTSICSCSPPTRTKNSPQQLHESDPLRGGDTLKRPCENNHETQPSKQRDTDHTNVDKYLDKQHTNSQQPRTQVSGHD
uniref:Uncharacterized protein n=1 Tax=Bactrocera dorsalis TaxID=27457 RepID=A0A034VTW8_BACDO